MPTLSRLDFIGFLERSGFSAAEAVQKFADVCKRSGVDWKDIEFNEPWRPTEAMRDWDERFWAWQLSPEGLSKPLVPSSATLPSDDFTFLPHGHPMNRSGGYTVGDHKRRRQGLPSYLSTPVLPEDETMPYAPEFTSHTVADMKRHLQGPPPPPVPRVVLTTFRQVENPILKKETG